MSAAEETLAHVVEHLNRYLGVTMHEDEAIEGVRSLALSLEDAYKQRDEARAEVERLRAHRARVCDALGLAGAPLDDVERKIAHLSGRGGPGLLDGSPVDDGRAVQALLDAHGYPLAEFGPVVRVMRLLGIQGVDLPGGER